MLLSTILTSRVVINERKATIRIGYINDHTVWKQYRVTGTKQVSFSYYTATFPLHRRNRSIRD